MAYITGYPIFRQAILVRFPEDGHPLLQRRLHCNAKRETMSVSHSHIISTLDGQDQEPPNPIYVIVNGGCRVVSKFGSFNFPIKRLLFRRSKRGSQKSLVLRCEKTGKEGPEEGVDPQVLSSHQTLT